jgi:uncharacterized membrane-anchored protein
MTFAQHPQRVALHNEVHARPPEPMQAPLALSHIVMLCAASDKDASREHLNRLLRDHHLPAVDALCTHLRTDVGAVRLRWEMHTEFVSWTFMRATPAEDTAGEPEGAIDLVPQTWLTELPGENLVALHLFALHTPLFIMPTWMRTRFDEDSLIASSVASGEAHLYTDLKIQADGYARWALLTGDLTPRRLGRLVQRILEIETYRMAALLGLPIARRASTVLGEAERELAQLAEAIRVAESRDEAVLLDRLTRLAAHVEGEYATTHARFSASEAYFDLVDKRVAAIGEQPLSGSQTVAQFMDRRLTPARSTCEWAARRQDALSQRISRMSNLLRTRVEIEQQVNSQALLAAMNRRQDLQLKLQATVEGLSVAAISYYIVGLLAYLAKGAHTVGWPFSAEVTAAVAIPIVVVAVATSLRRVHRRLTAVTTEG